MTIKYYSKVSYVLLIIVFVVFFSPLILSLIKKGISLNLILIGLFLIIIYGFIAHMFFNTEYKIDKSKLNIKCGFFIYKPIEIKDIKEISKSSNVISSPAPSFDRIEIMYGKFEKIIILPKNKFEFVDFLTKLNPNIKNNLEKDKNKRTTRSKQNSENSA